MRCRSQADLQNRTKETFVDGWVRTGDEVKMARNGDMFVVDRLKVKITVFNLATY